MAYSAYITKIKNIRKHSNADRLMIGQCFGNDIIIGKNVEEGELGIYFPTDGQLGVEYAEENNLLRKKDENGKNIGGYLDPDKRNIRTIKLRGEYSDGLFMPLKSLEKFTDITKLREGDEITVLGGTLICQKYVPKHNNSPRDFKGKQPKKNEYPYFHKHKDTKQLAYMMNTLREGELCYVTLKQHGTSARSGHMFKVTKSKPNIFQRMFNIKPKTKSGYELVTGSRNVTLTDGEMPKFRQKYHDFFKGKLKQGETVFYEIVGYEENQKTIMPSCGNDKVGDKEFKKQYGKTTTFTYGCDEGENDIYVYRMTMTNEEGDVIEYPWSLVKQRCEEMFVKHVPELDKFFYTPDKDIKWFEEKYCDKPDPIGKTHISEGVVVRLEDRPVFTALKHKGRYFKILEGIIKDEGIVDQEEDQ